MTTSPITRERVYEILSRVRDPEVPVLDIVEMGIVREVVVGDGRVHVSITPTYSGCPIMNVIGRDIRAALEQAGLIDVELETVYAPPWTTDWMTVDAKRKLEEYGIAPPGPVVEQPLFGPNRTLERVTCPFCKSRETSLTSEFGSTACKSLHYCSGCDQPFEHFKCL